MGLPADQFVSKMKKNLGDAYHVDWRKFDIDRYWVRVVANATGQVWETKIMYDDFKVLDPKVFSEMALHDIYDKAHDHLST